jgi:hypothetical protein
MTHRIHMPARLRRLYNIGVVVSATVGLIMAFLLTLERYDAAARTPHGEPLAAHSFASP